MADTIIRTGCLPYDDGSGYALDITIEAAAPDGFFDYERVRLNPDSEFTDFPLERWPEVRDAIDRAINARNQLHKSEAPMTDVLDVNDAPISVGDRVHHEPSQEDWIVLRVGVDSEGGYVEPAGWPPCRARSADCEVSKSEPRE